MTGNPYHRIFALDEEISEATTNEQLIKIRDYVDKNHKFSLETKKLLSYLVNIKGIELSKEVEKQNALQGC